MKKIGIIGLGRFGSFWASILTPYFEVYGYSKTTPKNAVCKIISLEEISKLNTIFICVPMRSVENLIKEISPLIEKNTLVIDTCSVKIKPVEWMLENLPQNIEIIASHPMFGPDSAKNGLDGLAMMMNQTRVTTKRYQKWLLFFKSLGINVIEMSPEEHDKQAAMSQALTHMLGNTLNRIGIEDSPIGTLWYKKLLAITKQVAKDSNELFYDMQRLNPYAKSMHKVFMQEWQNLIEDLDRHS